MAQDLAVGKRITGRIVKLMPFGAFVAIQDSDWLGLVKTPEITWQPISHPQDFLALDQMVEAEILAFRPEGKQIILSIKRCQKPQASSEV